jgi:hypothetical protein
MLVRLHHDLGLQRLLVGIADARELLDLPGTRLPVEPLHVARLAHLERRSHVDLDKIAAQRPHPRPRRTVGADGCSDHHGAVPCHQVGDVADALDVRVAIFTREPQPLRQVRPHHVAVEHLDPLAEAPQPRRQRLCHRALPRPRQPGEPQDDAPIEALEGRVLAALLRQIHGWITFVRQPDTGRAPCTEEPPGASPSGPVSIC